MARLVLSLDNQVLAEYNMNKERYTIGRLPDNDIRIDNSAVSGHHSLIINILNDSFLEDLNSTNGTYVNGKLIKKHALQHGDVITCGHHQLRFVEDDDAQQDEFEKTMVIQPSQRPVEKIQNARAKADEVSGGTGATTSRRALRGGGAGAAADFIRLGARVLDLLHRPLRGLDDHCLFKLILLGIVVFDEAQLMMAAGDDIPMLQGMLLDQLAVDVGAIGA